ncbi:MAG: bifunctional metallophosphatase/5'-nucleotidase [Cyanobacteriota bacterium]|nr:bifunctional metallophosphatase/5'-nucleotidase [Cyanobacteriota bacterium]
MRQRLRHALAALTLLACAPALAGPAAETIPLRLIAINDLHGHLEDDNLDLNWPDPANPSRATKLATGGAAALAGLVRSLRRDAPHSLVISGGDLFGASPLISALLRHESTLAVAHLIGIDLAAPGNHDFDAGASETLRLLRGGCASGQAPGPAASCALGPHPPARFATLAANIHTASGGNLFPPAAIHNVNGVKVGVIGAITQATPNLVVASGIAGLRFSPEAEAINQAAAALQRQGVEALVAVIHEGGETGSPADPLDWNNPACPNARGPIFAIARQLSPAIDAVFSAHSHQGYNCRLDGRPVLQATAYGRGVAVVDLVLNRRTGEVERSLTRSRNLPVLNSRTTPALRQAVLAAEPTPWRAALQRAQPDPATAQLVAQAAALVAPIAQREAGRIGGGFDRSGATDSTAGRLIADAQLAATRAPAAGGAEAALVNPGGIRANLPCRAAPACAVSYGELFALQPFGNSLVVLSLSGAELKLLLENQQGPGRPKPTFLQPSASLRYSWDARAPFGLRVRQLRLNGRPIAPDQPVRLVVNSFLAQGGDGFRGFLEGRDPVGGPLDLEALETFLRRRPAAAPDPVSRVTLLPGVPADF